MEPDVAHQTSWLKITGEYDIVVLSKDFEKSVREYRWSEPEGANSQSCSLGVSIIKLCYDSDLHA